MTYTVNQLAKLANISVRTLHYYDEMGLLKPSFVAKNGYRQYEQAELVRLQQILFFRELDFPLEEIKRMLDRPGFDVTRALHDQKELMKRKRKRLDGLIKSIDTTIDAMTNNKPLNEEEMYDPFKDDDVKQYQDEVKKRWGNTDAYKQSMARVSKLSKADMAKLKEDGKKFVRELAANMDKAPDSPEAQALIQKHYESIQFFYDCPIAMYRNLGEMYVNDPRFTAYYDKERPGLAVWVRDAIRAYCDIREKNV